jgi:hypothetical protein
MAISKSDFSSYIKSFRFRELFNEMGWNNDRTRQPIIVDESPFTLVGIAEKSGFKIFVCEPQPGCNLPDKATRKKIEGKVTKLFQEHLIIFIDEQKREQVWQLAVRKAGSPTKISETRFSLSKDPELLYQRASGLFFTLDEEEKVTIIDVTTRVAENFQQNNEKVTKKFYESFKKEHTTFMKFIQGIDDQLHMDWYASLMLNRLMFCYFIQKKGFLDNNKNYLQDKLKACKEKKGTNKFYSFYRDFLLALFHEGLGAPEHTKNHEVEIGQIPYLNGGLFDEHEIEKVFENIQIEDRAFEKLFDFFDQYEWHLDTRETASGRDINPDVIGYIFEKYINDRAQMGAYYTKEDITDYIAKNCIIPWLFDEVKRNYPQPFAADGWLWQMVKSSGNDYIYGAVTYGIPENGGLFDDLPDEIQKGFVTELEKKVVDGNGPWLWELRKSWNKPAPSDIALPTEIYREVIERRKRYADIKRKIEKGEIKEINEFITCNLNIRQFAQDVIETTDDAGFIRHFYKALSSITILDPTCGSGAFLFAAMNILEPLYEACIRRMKNFIDESGKGRHTFFEKTLARVNAPEHPNLQYFIYKSIILNNLYGVDIMNEAVEIAKLRLFLRLVATVDSNYRRPNLGLEPLPDVDFNIRSGNTLVGYVTEAQLKDAFAGKFDFDNEAEKIKEKCDMVSRAFARYKEIQLHGTTDFEDFKNAKDDLNQRLDKLRNELDVLLHKQYYENMKLNKWLSSHQPFHWFAEFYEIIHAKGGFDVVIGNPPYVEYGAVRSNYSIKNYITEYCGNLFAYTIERAYNLLKEAGRFGFIVPISSICTPRMKTVFEFERRNSTHLWVSNFAVRPDKLFIGADMNLTIHLANKGKININDINVFSTNYMHWYTEFRSYLFPMIRYIKGLLSFDGLIFKLQSPIEHQIMKNILSLRQTIISPSGKNAFIYYHSGGRYFRKCILEKLSNEYKPLKVPDKNQYHIISLYSSSVYFWYWVTFSDTYHVTKPDIESFRFPQELLKDKNILNLGKRLIEDLECNRIIRERQRKDGKIQKEINYVVSKSKPIIDQIDCLLAQHYGFTHEELDFIINYDIKYRMGKELNGEEIGE